MSNIVDIKNIMSKKNTENVKKEESCLEVVKEWLPKFIKNDVPSEYTITTFSRKWIHRGITTTLESMLAYPALDKVKLKHDDYKNRMFEDPIFLIQVSTNALSSLIKILLDKYNLDNYILYSLINELVSISDFIYSTRSEYYALPFKENKEIKGIWFLIKANDDSAIACKLTINVEQNK